MINNYRTAFIICFLILFGAISCNAPAHSDRPSHKEAVERAGGKYVSMDHIEKLNRIDGHRVYVPVYSHIYHRDDDVFYLTNTLSIRNTDEVNFIYITRVDYYDTKGKMVRKYLSSPILLPPMSTLEYVIGARDKIGGSGANFTVEWVSDKKISEPIVESIMISTGGQQGLSFLSRGVNID